MQPQLLPSGYRSGDLLADLAHATAKPVRCLACDHVAMPGQRVAQPVGSSGWAHLSCLASTAAAKGATQP